jgi:hypothetical protein
MKNRIAIWAAVGFLVSSCFVLFTLLVPPDYLFLSLRKPAVEALRWLAFRRALPFATYLSIFGGFH